MTKATETIKYVIDEVHAHGISGFNGIYSYVHFTIDCSDVDIESKTPTKMSLKDALAAPKSFEDNGKIFEMEHEGNVICKILARRCEKLDYHVTYSHADITEELEDIVASGRDTLEKFSRDLGFTPGRMIYNILDATISWDSVKTYYGLTDQEEEGWI